MTNIEALKMLKAKRECILKWIDPSGGCNDDKCDGCDLNYEQGRMGEQAEALHIAIESLEAWEKVKEEIQRKANSGQWSEATTYGMNKSISIINKHLSEVSE